MMNTLQLINFDFISKVSFWEYRTTLLMALEGMGPILPYYWGKFTQIDFQTGDTLGLTYIICFLSILTLIVLGFLRLVIEKTIKK